MKIKSILSFILILVSIFSTTVSAQNKDITVDSEWTKKIDENGKIYYSNKKTNESIVQAFKYDENGEFVEVSLDDTFPMIQKSFEALKTEDKAEERNNTEENKNEDEVSILTDLYFVWDYIELYSSTNMGAGQKVSPDAQGPTVISYGTSVSTSNSFSLSVSADYAVKEVIKAGASFGWTTTTTSSATFGVGYEIPAGKRGAVYFAPYYNYTRGTLTKKTYTFTGGLQSVDTWYNQSAKSPKNLGNGLADGYYYLVLN